MDTPILATKLFIPPTRPELVVRPRLLNELFEGLHHKLTLISAEKTINEPNVDLPDKNPGDYWG
jgi:hypothetical protein